MSFGRLLPLMVVTALVVTACNRDGEEASATTAAPAVATDTTAPDVAGAADTTVPAASPPETPVTEATAAVGQDGTTTVATEPRAAIPGYEVVHRLIEDDRETLVVVVEPGTYTNVELENLVYDIVERYSPSAAIVVDDRAVADLALLEELTEEQQTSLDAHTFLRIEKGVEVTFHGPYNDFPGLTVGS